MRRIILMVLKCFYFAPYAVWKIGHFAKKEGSYEEAYAYIKKVTKKMALFSSRTIRACSMCWSFWKAVPDRLHL